MYDNICHYVIIWAICIYIYIILYNCGCKTVIYHGITMIYLSWKCYLNMMSMMLIALVWGSQGSLPGGHHRSFHQVWHQEAGRNGQAAGVTMTRLRHGDKSADFFKWLGVTVHFFCFSLEHALSPERRVLVCRGNCSETCWYGPVWDLFTVRAQACPIIMPK